MSTLARPQRVLGVDPGSLHTGWGVLERRGARWSALEWGRVSPSGELELPQRLRILGAGIEEVLERWRPDVVVLEASFHGRSTRSLIVEYAPAEVKSAVTGSGRADKSQVARMVSLQLGLTERPVADAADALAVALCFTVRSRGALAEAAAAPGGARKSQNRLKL